MSDALERILNDAEESSAGRAAMRALVADCKNVAQAAGDLSMCLYKFHMDGTVSAARMASDTDDERLVFRCLHDAWAALKQAEGVTRKLHIAALREAGRIQ